MKKQSIGNYTQQYIARQQQKRVPLDPASWQQPQQVACEKALATGKGNVIIFKKREE